MTPSLCDPVFVIVVPALVSTAAHAQEIDGAIAARHETPHDT